MENFNELALTWDDEPRRVERAKIIADEIITAIPGLKGMRGFEYGCGTGLLSVNLQAHVKHITLGDNSQGMLSVLKQKIEAAGFENMTPLMVDLSEKFIDDGRFDAIYTLLTLHHISDTDKVIASFSNMLNPHGYLCIADLDTEDGSFHGKGFTGHNGFNRSELAAKLMKFGFENISSKTCYQNIRKCDDGIERTYPIFFMTGQKKV